MFPVGWPGLGLLLLRFAVAVSTAAIAYRPDHHTSYWMLVFTGLSVVGLCVGTWTPVSSALALAIQLSSSAIWPDAPAFRLVGAMITVALLLLGPGAYSIDARRFGRKVVKIPGREPPVDN